MNGVLSFAYGVAAQLSLDPCLDTDRARELLRELDSGEKRHLRHRLAESKRNIENQRVSTSFQIDQLNEVIISQQQQIRDIKKLQKTQ